MYLTTIIKPHRFMYVLTQAFFSSFYIQYLNGEGKCMLPIQCFFHSLNEMTQINFHVIIYHIYSGNPLTPECSMNLPIPVLKSAL